MPKLNNKGFGLIPILVISLLIGVLGVFTFNYLSSNGVLSKTESRDLAQVNNTSPNKTVPSKAVIEATLSYNETSGYQTGNIRLNLKGSVNDINALRGELNKYGLEVQDYCMTAACPKARIVKPRISFVENRNFIEINADVPVTGMVKSISYKSYPQRNRFDMPQFVFKSRLDNWTISLNDESRTFSLVRNNESTNIGVYLKSANSTTGQTNLEFLINGIGDDTAKVIRSIRTNGVKRIDRVGFDTYRTATVRPVVTYNGQGQMIISALSTTSSIYLVLDNNTKVEFLPVPKGWQVNQKGDGLDRISSAVKPSVVDITLISTSGKNATYLVTVTGEGAYKQILEIINTKGINRVDGTSFNNSKTTTLRPIPRMFEGSFSFTVTALPNTISFYVNSSEKNLFAVPGKIPAGWKINQNFDGLDRIGNR